MVSEPEIAQFIDEFETVSNTSTEKHHKQTKSYQHQFINLLPA